jgi:hypothetical protein
MWFVIFLKVDCIKYFFREIRYIAVLFNGRHIGYAFVRVLMDVTLLALTTSTDRVGQIGGRDLNTRHWVNQYAN